jgi:FMN phosphatase YigB (HAD superfamily)
VAGGRRVRAVLFDFDGTLVDTMGEFADLAGELVAGAHGWTVAEGRAAYLRTSGIPFCQQLEVLFPGHPGNGALMDAFESGKLRFYEGKGLLPDVRPAVAALRARGIRAIVSSNNYGPVVERFLAAQAPAFDLVLGFGDGGLAKGEPHFARVLAAFGLERGELLFVGDSVRDAELATEAGVAFVGRRGTVAPEAFEARFGRGAFPLVDGLDELLPLVVDQVAS